jgi:hypothetical protein
MLMASKVSKPPCSIEKVILQTGSPDEQKEVSDRLSDASFCSSGNHFYLSGKPDCLFLVFVKPSRIRNASPKIKK